MDKLNNKCGRDQEMNKYLECDDSEAFRNASVNRVKNSPLNLKITQLLISELIEPRI